MQGALGACQLGKDCVELLQKQDTCAGLLLATGTEGDPVM